MRVWAPLHPNVTTPRSKHCHRATIGIQPCKLKRLSARIEMSGVHAYRASSGRRAARPSAIERAEGVADEMHRRETARLDRRGEVVLVVTSRPRDRRVLGARVPAAVVGDDAKRLRAVFLDNRPSLTVVPTPVQSARGSPLPRRKLASQAVPRKVPREFKKRLEMTGNIGKQNRRSRRVRARTRRSLARSDRIRRTGRLATTTDLRHAPDVSGDGRRSSPGTTTTGHGACWTTC
jgi:hypothetical protein